MANPPETPGDSFDADRKESISALGADSDLRRASLEWLIRAQAHKYSYHFNWLGRPIIQFPQDVVAMQEILWSVKPDLVIETGIARGGSVIFYASILELIGGVGQVLGIDVDIRDHNRREITSHPMAKRIRLLEGSSVEPGIVEEVQKLARGSKRVLVALDSNHTHAHVLREMELYSPLVTRGSYLVVFDTIIEELPDHLVADRPWRKGNSPQTAVAEFLGTTDRFELDQEIQDKLLITVAPGGYLRCVKD